MDDTTAQVLEAVDSASGQPQAGEVRLSTGVTIRVHALSRDVYEDILARFKEPQVPVVMNSDKGRAEENPSDPDYERALREYNASVNRAIKLAVYALAVEVLSVPDAEWGPDGATWLEYRAAAGLASGDTRSARKIDWLRFYAARADADSNTILRVAGRMLGVLEVDAAEAMKRV